MNRVKIFHEKVKNKVIPSLYFAFDSKEHIKEIMSNLGRFAKLNLREVISEILQRVLRKLCFYQSNRVNS